MSGAFRRWALPASVVFALAALALLSGILDAVRRGAADQVVRLASRHAPGHPVSYPDVAIVAIDPQSLRAHPDWPWPRDLYARLVDRLEEAGARAVGFDIDFSTPRDPAHDQAFAAAIERSGRVALASFRQSQPVAEGLEVEIASVPIARLADAAAALGSVLVPVDPDGVVRRFPRRSSIATREIPSLAGATLALALQEPLEAPPSGSSPAFARIDFRRAQPPIPVLSIADVLAERIDPRDLAGRVVLVGATAAEFQDLWTTPLGPARPGVWIQAVALRTLAAERAGQPVLRGLDARVELALLACLSALAALLGFVSHGRRLLGLGALGSASVTAAPCWAVFDGALFDPILPLGVLAAHYVLGIESVRRHFGRSLEERDHSLSALLQVGQATVTAPAAAGSQAGSPPPGAGGIDVALALLGDVVQASGVAFLRANPEGHLDGRRLEWTRIQGRSVGHDATARRVLAAHRTRSFDGAIPGEAARHGMAIYLPLRAGDDPIGVLIVEREGPRRLDEAQLRTVATVGTQLALSAHNLRLLEDLQTTFDTSIAAIASAIEARDGYTESHCRRLAAFSAAMATRIGLPEVEVEAIRLGALLHDVGKIGIRDEILMKPGVYSPEERREMERHADIGHGIVARIHGMSATTAACVRHHHERWDGRGYPDGLTAEAIPLGARLVTVVDVWDALSTERPYKKALPQHLVRELLEKDRGTRFDPELLSIFLRVLDEEGEEMLAVIDRTSGPRA